MESLLTDTATAVTESFNNLDSWQQVLVLLVGSAVLAKFTEGVILRAAQRYTKESSTKFDDLLVREAHTPLYVTIVLGGVYGSVQLLEVAQTGEYIASSAVTVSLVLWARAALRVGNQATDLLHSKEDPHDLAPLLSNIWSVVVVAGTGVALLTLWEINVTPFLASAGVVGIVVGLAAREALSNFIGGVALYFDDTYRVGDVIKLEGGERGTVQHVGIRSTTIRTRDNIAITVPNSVLNDARIVNQSEPEHRTRLRIPISVAYGTDPDRVDDVLHTVAEENPQVLDQPEPNVLLTEFGDSALHFKLHIYIGHPLHEPQVRDAVNRAAYTKLQDAGVEIPFPQRTVHYADQPAEQRESPASDGA